MNKPSVAVLAFLSGLLVAAVVRSAPSVLGRSTRSWEEIEAGGDGKGNSRPIFRSATATLDELEMHVTHLAPGKAPHPPHKHAEEELVIIKEGTLEALNDGKTRKLGPGSVIFQASNQLHGVRNVGDVPAVYHVIRWRSPGMPTTAAPAPAKPATK
jgi:quercetin dioxygenase-like cupin family protein